jgi:endonuclease YncB( thermonuclease family)
MKEIILSIALLLAFSLRTEGQSKDSQRAPTARLLSFEHEDECGSPLRESMLWMSVEGKVIKVVDGDTIILLTKDNKRKRVNLVAVDASAGQDAARSLLSGFVLNRAVSVLVNPSNVKSGIVVGVVHAQEKDVNRELLEAGVVRYHGPESYGVSDYTACVYRIVEREAREAKRGLWRNAARRS